MNYNAKVVATRLIRASHLDRELAKILAKRQNFPIVFATAVFYAIEEVIL